MGKLQHIQILAAMGVISTRLNQFLKHSIALIIPCHRIIDEKGNLVGYGGGLPLKLRLLNLEQNLFIF